MSTLAVIAYPEQDTAAKAATKLSSMQKEYLIELEDVAWVTKSPEGKMKLHQGSSLTAAGAAGGALGIRFRTPLSCSHRWPGPRRRHWRAHGQAERLWHR
jgi:uncharacterized membrane protein